MGVIAEQLGHADTRMTEKHYAHLALSCVADTIRAHLPMLGIGVDEAIAAEVAKIVLIPFAQAPGRPARLTTAVWRDPRRYSRGGGAVVMPSKQRQYSGKLAKPIVWDAPPTFEGFVSEKRVKEFWKKYSRHQRKVKDRVDKQIAEKLSLLMEFYGITNKNDMGALALALATEHVPGFKVVPQGGKKRGRKKVWDGPKLQALLQAVLTVKEKHRFTDRQALHFMSTKDESAATWGPPVGYRGSKRQWVETLESRLQDAKRYDAFVGSFFADFAKSAQKFQKK